MLTNLSPRERFTHYLIRYGDGDENATIFCVEWSSTDISGYARVPLVSGYIEANMTLEPRGEGPLLPVPMEMEDHPSFLDVDLCISFMSIHASTTAAGVTPIEPFFFPPNSARMSVVYLREHNSFPGYVRSFNNLLPGTVSAAETRDKTPSKSETASAKSKSKSSRKKKEEEKKKKKKDRSKPNDDNNEGAEQSDEKNKTTFAKIDTGNSSAADCTKKSSDAAAKEESFDTPDTTSSNKGGLESIVDPYFSQKYPGVMDAAFTVLNDLFLYPSHAPWIEGPGLCLAAESCYGNKPSINLQRDHYLRQSFSKTDLYSIPVDDNTRICFVYGAGYGSATFGTVEE